MLHTSHVHMSNVHTSHELYESRMICTISICVMNYESRTMWESMVEMSCYTWVTYAWVTNDMCYIYMRYELYESRTIYESMVGLCYTWITNYKSHESYALFLYESRTIRVRNHMREYGGDWVMLQMSLELYESRVIRALHLSHEVYETRAVWESIVEMGSCYTWVTNCMRHERYALSTWVTKYMSHEP